MLGRHRDRFGRRDHAAEGVSEGVVRVALAAGADGAGRSPRRAHHALTTTPACTRMRICGRERRARVFARVLSGSFPRGDGTSARATRRVTRSSHGMDAGAPTPGGGPQSTADLTTFVRPPRARPARRPRRRASRPRRPPPSSRTKRRTNLEFERRVARDSSRTPPRTPPRRAPR